VSQVPYREGAQPVRDAPPASFERPWVDAEKAGDSWAIYQLAATGVVASILLGVAWWPLGALGVAGTVGYLALRSKGRRPVTLAARVDDAGLTVRFHDAVVRQTPLAALRDVEVDSNEIKRVTYHQAVGDPMPSTQVSGDVRVARLTARLDDGRVERLTVTAGHYDEAMATFGKLRVFLRAHGWKPVDER